MKHFAAAVVFACLPLMAQAQADEAAAEARAAATALEAEIGRAHV